MARPNLTADDIKAMQEARKQAKVDKDNALAALAENSQFTNPKFWTSVDSDTVEDIKKAISKAEKALKSKEIARLQKKIEALKAE